MSLSRLVPSFVSSLPFFVTLGLLAPVETVPSHAQASSRVAINGSFSRIIVSVQEPPAVQRAAKDLQSDFAKVLGRTPQIVDGFQDAGPLAIFIGQRDHIPAGLNCATTTDREAFALSIARLGNEPKAANIICLTGTDMRGTIYAIYEF